MTVVAQLVNGRAGVRPALLARTSITLFLISVPLGSTPSILPGASTEYLSLWRVGAPARVSGPHDLKQERGQVLASATISKA